jgi:7,8-dihydropterin-6-yl-methyl-4-(beta-D-ribofuranosyl)aminobenzene 5'-phosphate synthase
VTPADLRPVDRLDVLVLIDNVTDSLSTTPKNVVPEWAGLSKAGRLPELSGAAICCAHHGLSLLVTTHIGGESHTMLFDAGPEGATLLRNATILGVDFGRVEAAVLSHGHWDHGGGLLTAIETIVKARGHVECFMHPGMFAQRASRLADGTVLVQQRPADPPRLTSAGANVVVTRDPQLIAGGTVYVSGEVPRVTPYEVGLPGHMRRGANGEWEPDPLIIDERFIAVRVKDKGLFVLSGCSHAGIVNVLTHAREVFTADGLYGVMGGFHLAGVNEKIIPDTVSDLTRFGLEFMAPGHCTGWRAMTVIAREFGDRLAPSAVGKRYAL